MSDAFAPRTPPDTDAFRAAVTAQAEAADPAHSAWVAANAGSGKTKVLIDRVARLLLNDAEPDSILCITYTRAAANEMMSRLFDRLGKWSVMRGEALAVELGRLQGRIPQSYSGDELRKARALFAKALETPGGLRIETIHAFCARLLRRFPLEAGVLPGFREIEEADAALLWERAARAAVLDLQDHAPDKLDALALEGGGLGAKAAVAIVAGEAGRLRRYGNESGDRGLKLRAALGAPDQTSQAVITAALAAIPRTRYAGAIDNLRGGKATDQKTAELLHSVLGAGNSAEGWEQLRGLWRTGTGGLRKSNPYTRDVAVASPDIADLFQIKDGEGSEITRLKQAEQDWLAALAAERTEALFALALPLLEQYQAQKTARGALDFDDLIDAARALLTRPGIAPWVLYKLDGGISHLLLDEAQDTSPDQWDLINALTEEFFAGEGAERDQDPRTLFVVGDEKQSIYSFQGADPDLFLTGRQSFTLRAGETRTPDMAMSFRSSPEVLHFVDLVFDSGAFDGPAFSEHVPPEADLMRHTARRANQPGEVVLWPLEPPPETEDADAWDAPVDALGERSPKIRLARRVAGEVSDMIARGDTAWREGAGGTWQRAAIRPGDVLILVRGRTGGLFDALIQELKRAGLPVAGADRLILADHIGVQDCLNLMRFALMPEDDLTLAEILRGPFCDLVEDDEVLFPLAHGRGSASLWQRVQQSDIAPLAPVRGFLERIISRRGRPAFEFLSAVLEEQVIDGETGWQRIGARLGTPARDPLEALLARAIAADGEAGASLQAFISALEHDDSEVKRDLAESGGAVRVMTVHGAKGLQAPLVVLPDTTSPPRARRGGLLNVAGAPVWSPRAAADTESMAAAREALNAADLREHRRLLYVALTRAQDRLLVCGHWHGRGETGHDRHSWYALCQAAMDQLGVAEDERGARRLGEPMPAMTTALGEPDGEGEHRPAWIDTPVAPETNTHRTLSPSQLGEDAGPAFSPLDPERAWRLQRGRLIHRLLEHLPRVPAQDRDVRARALLAGAGINADAADEIRATVLATLAAPDLAYIFSANARAEAAIIGTSPGWPEGTVINGRVDRLLVTEEKVLIVDIKTDRPPPADASGIEEAYLRQMAAYRSVLQTAWPDRQIECAIVWTDGPRRMALTDEMLLAALKRAQSGL